MPCAQLPQATHRFQRPNKIKQSVDLMNRLIDERAASFCLPASLNRTGVIFIGAEPLDVSISLQQFAQPACTQSPFEKDRRIVKAMLAHNVEWNAGGPGSFDDLACCFEIRGDRLL